MTVLRAFGRRVHDKRMDLGMTQKQLADMIGLTRTSVANIEAGRQDTTISTVVALGLALGENPAHLIDLGREPVPPKWAAVLQAENRELRRQIERIRKIVMNGGPVRTAEDHSGGSREPMSVGETG